MISLMIVYTKMIIGGSTTSLLSLLNIIDYSKYKVDLMLLDKTGDLQSLVHPKVNVICAPQSAKYKYFHPKNIKHFIDSRKFSFQYKNRLIRSQFMTRVLAFSMKINTTYYDYGISFLEFWPTQFLAYNMPNVKKKFAWLHVDYQGARLYPKVDEELYGTFDKIITVSQECRNIFASVFPQYSSKTICIENILDKGLVIQQSFEPCPYEIKSNSRIKIISCCRLDNAHKGLDRVLFAFLKIKSEYTVFPFDWYIVGDGKDYNAINEYISMHNLEENIVLLGKFKNPYPLIKQADWLIQPSRYEGKPMVVTEAQMLGVVPCVTAYLSANEQIINDFDGVIVMNSDTAVYDFLKMLAEGKINTNFLKSNLHKKDFSNKQAISTFYSLISE